VHATELGLKNITRVAGFLLGATCKEGEDYQLLRNMYDQLVRQRERELGHVVNLVGGMVENNLWYGQADHVFDRVNAAKQREAVAFLNQHAFQTPLELVDTNILARLESSGAADRILASQRRLLGSLVNDQRLKRMAELANRAPPRAYPPAELLSDLRANIWSELQAE